MHSLYEQRNVCGAYNRTGTLRPGDVMGAVVVTYILRVTFALNPPRARTEAVRRNFSKVSHARHPRDRRRRLRTGLCEPASDTCEDDYIVDVYGVYYATSTTNALGYT